MGQAKKSSSVRTAVTVSNPYYNMNGSDLGFCSLISQKIGIDTTSLPSLPTFLQVAIAEYNPLDLTAQIVSSKGSESFKHESGPHIFRSFTSFDLTDL